MYICDVTLMPCLYFVFVFKTAYALHASLLATLIMALCGFML